MYGALYDNSCLVWATKCGESLNCLVYDTDKLRQSIIYVKVSLLMAAVFFDCIVWYYSKGLDIYGDASATIDAVDEEDVAVEASGFRMTNNRTTQYDTL